MTCAHPTTDLDRSRGIPLLAVPRRILATLVCWHRRAVDRRALAAMPPERWRDIAKNPDAIRREVAKPFWRP